MVKIFYDHLVVREEVFSELQKYTLSVEERSELEMVVDETLHHHILDEILKHLPTAKHKEFLTKFHAAPHDEKLLEYLRVETTVDIEVKIRSRAEKAKAVLLSEIRKAKKK